MLEDLAEKRFRGLERFRTLERQPRDRARDGGQVDGVLGVELGGAGGEERVEHGALLLTVRDARQFRTAQRLRERIGRLAADRSRGAARGEERQKIGDDVAALQASQRPDRRAGERWIRYPRRLEQHRDVVLGRSPGIFDCQDDRKSDGWAPRLGAGRAGQGGGNREAQATGDVTLPRYPNQCLRPEYSSICVVRSIGYEILTSETLPSADVTA
jgi:hypothetical protein